MPSGGKRSSIASYTWSGWESQNDLTGFRNVFQPDQGIRTGLSARSNGTGTGAALGFSGWLQHHLHTALI